MSKDYYGILGVTKESTDKEIKKAYRNLSKKYHPDKVQHLGEEFQSFAKEKMQKLNEAYKALSKS